MESLQMFMFVNGTDLITIAACDSLNAFMFAFEMCENFSSPLTLVGSSIFTKEMTQQLLQVTIH